MLVKAATGILYFIIFHCFPDLFSNENHLSYNVIYVTKKIQ